MVRNAFTVEDGGAPEDGAPWASLAAPRLDGLDTSPGGAGRQSTPCNRLPSSLPCHRNSARSQRCVHKSRVTQRRTRSSSKSSSCRSSARPVQNSCLIVMFKHARRAHSRRNTTRRGYRGVTTPRLRHHDVEVAVFWVGSSAQLPPPSTPRRRNIRPDTILATRTLLYVICIHVYRRLSHSAVAVSFFAGHTVRTGR